MIIDSMVRVALPLVTASDTIQYIWGSCNSSVAPCLSTSIIASSHLKFCHLLVFHKQWHQSKHLFSLLISMLMVFSFILNVAGKKDSRKMKIFISVLFSDLGRFSPVIPLTTQDEPLPPSRLRKQRSVSPPATPKKKGNVGRPRKTFKSKETVQDSEDSG